MKIIFDGDKALIQALNKVKSNVRKEANKAIAGAAMRTVAIAKNRLQPDGNNRELNMEIGAVRQSINFTHDSANLSANIFAGNTSTDNLAAYLDFGTGRFAASYVRTLPPEFQKLAMTFFKNGKGTLRSYAYFSSSYIQERQRLVEKLKGLKIGW